MAHFSLNLIEKHLCLLEATDFPPKVVGYLCYI